MQKFINLICHPSRIVLYFNDKVYKIIIWLLGFIIALFGIIAGLVFTTKQYDAYFSQSVTDVIISKDADFDIAYKDSKLSGSAYAIKANGIYIYFCKSDFAHNDYGLVMNFKEEQVDIYYRLFSKKTLYYKDLNIKDFTFNDVKHNQNQARIYFEDLIQISVDSINNEASIMAFFDNASNALIMLGALVLISVVFSLFINPHVQFRHRIRICIYDSIIYLVMMMFTLMFQIAWLQYVALVLPIFYCNISFRSIVVIKKG